MQESYGEGPATHTGLESCVGSRKATGEALTEVVRADQLSRESATPSQGGLLRSADAVVAGGRPHRVPRHGERRAGSARSKMSCTYEHTMHGNREIPESPVGDGPGGRVGKSNDARRR
jgi:hypothetical protein